MKFSLILVTICIAVLFPELNGSVKLEEFPNEATRAIHESKRFFKSRTFKKIAGMAERTANSVVHSVCASLLKAGLVNPRVTPTADQMSFIFFKTCNKTKIPISNPKQLLTLKQFDKTKPTVLFIHGWLSSYLDHKINPIVKAFNCRGDSNFMVFDTHNSISTLYSWSALNTDAVGRIIAEGLIKLKKEIPAEKIHIIGFSLGAQIAGSVARYYRQITGNKIQRVTGLDPANPCFGKEALRQVKRHDANFVDILHTNPGGFGKREPLGDIDFYANGLVTIKKGCSILGCSHMRALDYYAESIYPGHEYDFTAKRCKNKKLKKCKGPLVPMGLKAPSDKKGIYKFVVNEKSPYGKNSFNSNLLSSKCGICTQRKKWLPFKKGK